MNISTTSLALIDRALEEDVGSGDVTTLWTVPEHQRTDALILAKAPGVVAGCGVAREVFRRVDPELRVTVGKRDGEHVAPGVTVLRVHGSTRAILTAERVALNFLQRLSGIASLTRRYVDAVQGTGARILDTRKTTPGMRELEKQAVLAGGGGNHRFGLYDMVLIKENHIAAAGGIAAAVASARTLDRQGLKVEVEVTSFKELEEALRCSVDRVLLDNMSADQMRDAVQRIRRADPRPEAEASGGITLESIRGVAETGVDFISVGALTHSVPALDLSLLLDPA